MALQALIIEPVHPVLLETLSELGYTYKLVKSMTTEEAIAEISAYQGIITSNKLYINKAIIDAGTQLKWIGRMGSGMEIIDVPYAQSKGIVCINSPEGNANAVAEQALGMYLSLQHRIVKSHVQLQNNIFQRDENRGFEIENTVAGIIGFGNNGRLFAQKLAALGVHVYAYDNALQGYDAPNITACDSLDQIYKHATMLSFHVPLNDTTFHYFDTTFLNAMQQPFTLLNLSRGSILDLDIVLNGMQSGKILAAGIDVWPEEPITSENAKHYATFQALMKFPLFIGTAHIGGYTHEATYKMSYYVAMKIKSMYDNL